jgi:hypothetical protein
MAPRVDPPALLTPSNVKPNVAVAIDFGATEIMFTQGNIDCQAVSGGLYLSALSFEIDARIYVQRTIWSDQNHSVTA